MLPINGTVISTNPTNWCERGEDGKRSIMNFINNIDVVIDENEVLETISKWTGWTIEVITTRSAKTTSTIRLI